MDRVRKEGVWHGFGQVECMREEYLTIKLYGIKWRGVGTGLFTYCILYAALIS